MDFGDFLALVHILAAVIWVGGSIALGLIAARAVRRAEDQGMRAMADSLQTLGNLFGVSSAVVLGFGIWAVVHAPWASFSDLWIWLSLAITTVLVLVGPLFFAPQGKKLLMEAGAKGGAHPDVLSRAKGIVTAANIDAVAKLVVVYLMVAKPGA